MLSFGTTREEKEKGRVEEGIFKKEGEAKRRKIKEKAREGEQSREGCSEETLYPHGLPLPAGQGRGQAHCAFCREDS